MGRVILGRALEIDEDLYEEIELKISEPFAVSYFSTATISKDGIMPHTLTGYYRIKQNTFCMELLSKRGIKLVEPLPFGDPRRPDTKRARA